MGARPQQLRTGHGSARPWAFLRRAYWRGVRATTTTAAPLPDCPAEPVCPICGKPFPCLDHGDG
ncbi:hypothetical protein ACH4OW_26165 [Streptomyces sp. NPDC017056]|uniref:hypothetical protein n=1 Tax=Streptomyces sp. NPDC017056 TaxID=3364973 RepID=UPI00378EE5B1